MGTGSQRRNRRSKYADYRANGVISTQEVPPTEGPRNPGTYGVQNPSFTNTMRQLGDYGLGDIGSEGGHGRGGARAGILGGQDRMTPEEGQQWLHNQDAMRLGSQKAGDYVAWMNALNKGKHEPTMMEKINAQFESLYGDQTADIRNAYKGQEAALNKQYDAMLARLGTEHGQAERGVRQEGAQLQSALTAIGADAAGQMAQSNRAIDQQYAKALAGINNDYKPLAADLKAAGASGAGLQAEASAGRNDLREAHVADSTLGARYQQMLGQEINNRQATGATVTTANVQDLARILQQSRDNSNADRMGAVAKIEASMAGDLAQAKTNKAQARYSFFLDALKGGGTIGDAATAAVSPSVALSIKKAQASGIPDWREPFAAALKGLKNDEDGEQIAKIGEFETAISTGKTTPTEALLAWLASGKDGDMPAVGRALNDAVAYGQAVGGKAELLGTYGK